MDLAAPGTLESFKPDSSLTRIYQNWHVASVDFSTNEGIGLKEQKSMEESIEITHNWRIEESRESLLCQFLRSFQLFQFHSLMSHPFLESLRWRKVRKRRNLVNQMKVVDISRILLINSKKWRTLPWPFTTFLKGNILIRRPLITHPYPIQLSVYFPNFRSQTILSL